MLAISLTVACATDMMVLFFTHIPFVVNHTINATPPERLQHYLMSSKSSVCSVYGTRYILFNILALMLNIQAANTAVPEYCG